MGCILTHGFFFGGLFAFVSGSPFVYIELHHVPVDQYGFLFAMNIIGMGLCNIINMRLMGRFQLKTMLSFGSGASCLAGLVLLFNAWSGFGGLAGLVVPVVLFVSCLGFTGPNSNAMALSYFPGLRVRPMVLLALFALVSQVLRLDWQAFFTMERPYLWRPLSRAVVCCR